jgi:peptidoglycan DL-endopeptidase CwlO
MGSAVDLADVLPGDLIFYGNGGSVNHVAMAIGGGQVIHASSARTGIKISNMYYRTPIRARRFLSN